MIYLIIYIFELAIGAGIIYLCHRLQTGSGTHPSSCSVDFGAVFPGVKRPGREAYHSSPSSVGLRIPGTNNTFTLHYVLMVWCLIKQLRLHGVVLS